MAEQKPVVCIIVGMAGCGKTTVMRRINAYTYERDMPTYIINLDPAVAEVSSPHKLKHWCLQVPFGANINIQDTVNYKEIMKKYNLGPNGGIITSLNLFATRFDKVVSLKELISLHRPANRQSKRQGAREGREMLVSYVWNCMMI